MAKRTNIVGAHLPPLAAAVIVGTSSWGENSGAGLTATGTGQSDALQLTADVNHIGTTAASTGVKLDPNASLSDSCFIFNGGANTLTVYPPTSGTINGGSANAGVSLATLKAGEFVKTSSTNWAYVVTG